MLFFGVTVDRFGRRTGIVFATFFLVLGIILATASHGKDQLGLYWMMIVARGIAGFGASGEYPVCGTSAAEASDESPEVRRRRGILVAISTDFAIDLGFVISGCVALIVLACYHNRSSEGVWRICFGLGIVASILVARNFPQLIDLATSLGVLFSDSDDQLHTVSKACHQAQRALRPCS